MVLIVLAGLLVFCFRRKSSDISAVEPYSGYGNKQFAAPPFEYQQTNPPVPVFNDIAGGRTHGVSAGTGGWPSVNSDGVAGGRVGRPF